MGIGITDATNIIAQDGGSDRASRTSVWLVAQEFSWEKTGLATREIILNYMITALFKLMNHIFTNKTL
ncbi:MAG: hypothetical protein F6K54_23705 [Okeania sp. SIO3B5]|uniref:hypothetical protein n=1 Tax=Okeania sp. SIO3B5 TaxID=2607811 RepID=UPI0014003D77|nr:hypothetical protein [Okeania sp. SIO3B5]NEO55808.1 hypothetical protein [Okeania sp. SIO3B5]